MAKKTGAAVQVNTAAGGRSFWKQLRKQKTLVLMALLPVIMVIIFKYIPMYGILIAFKITNQPKGSGEVNGWIPFSRILSHFSKT